MRVESGLLPRGTARKILISHYLSRGVRSPCIFRVNRIMPRAAAATAAAAAATVVAGREI